MTFRDVTAIRPAGDGHFEVELDPRWSIGGRANGGYLLAIMGRAAGTVVTQPHVIAASALFLHSPEPGTARVEVETLRSGRNTSQVRARLSQAGSACVEALITMSTLASPGPYWSGGLPDAGGATADDAIRLGGRSPSGIEVPLLDELDLRVDPASLGFGTGTPSGRGELWGWLALPDGEPFDPLSLVFAVDAFPPATFDIELSGWVPTLELTVYVRALPAAGPVRVLQKARLIDDGRVDEACFVWDSTGRLVAQGTQLAGIRLG